MARASAVRGFAVWSFVALGAAVVGCGGASGTPHGPAAQTVAAPTFSPDGGTFDAPQTVALASATDGATIRYSIDGTTPSASAGTVYAGPFTLDAAATVRAIAVKAGMADSEVVQRSFAIGAALQPVVDPSFTPDGGTFDAPVAVSIATTTQGATIRYTTDGTTPSASHGDPYADPIQVGATTTLRAIAVKAGMTDSAVIVRTFTIDAPLQQVAAPTVSPDGGTFTAGQTVTLATATPGATIRYTTNGTTPSSTVGTVYTAPFSLPKTARLLAVAVKPGMADSSAVGRTFTIIDWIGRPVFSPLVNYFTGSLLVSLATPTPGATIRYTLDGSTPGLTTGTVYGGPFTISASTTVRAIAYTAGGASSILAKSYVQGAGPAVSIASATLARTTVPVDSHTDVGVTIHNASAATLSQLYIQRYVLQAETRAWRPAGGELVHCGADLSGQIPPGDCHYDFLDALWVSNSASGEGTLVAGPAAVRFELYSAGDYVIDVVELPVTLTGG